MSDNFAAIDLGSNSCRLLIADKDGKYIFQNNHSVRLGEGMHESGIISDAAFARAVNCFKEFRQSLDKYEVIKYRAITTAACRKAKNSKEFLETIKKESNIDIEIIDGLEEAMLNLEGAMMNADKDKKYIVVFDMGGGSTELTLATNSNNLEIVYSISIPWGARNASEAFGFGAYDESKADKLRAEIKKYVEEFLQKSNFENCKEDICVVATSSGPLRIAAIQHGFDKYNREKADGLVIDMNKLADVWNLCFNMSVEQMASSPLIGENRSVIFVPGCIIFDTILNQGFRADKVIASLKSAKDGIIKRLIK